jgi:succinate dehydrogenase / fumarate reductase cytochrome b subunit
MIIFRHRWHSGSVAWLIHRATGIALTLYIFAHLYVLSSLHDPSRFERMTELAHSPFVKLLELGLLVAVAAHAINGARVTVLELGAPTALQKPLFWAGAAAVLGIMGAGAVFMFGGTA